MMATDGNYDLNNLPEHGQRRGLPVAKRAQSISIQMNGPDSDESAAEKSDFDSIQWTLMGAGQFLPSGKAYTALPAGFYKVGITNGRIFAERQTVVSDKLSVLPGSCNERVIAQIQKFWNSREIYAKYGLSYKRGILFYGPPGAGKSATVTLLSLELIRKYGGAVFICQDPNLLAAMMAHLRKIEPIRPLIIILEDLDEIIEHSGEHSILALLDGELQIDNVVFLATTNYPDRLGGRIVNRPARFDDRIEVTMPSELTRRAYLLLVTKTEPLTEQEFKAWTNDTEGMSIAHIRELVVAVRCLGHDYKDVIARLKTMAIRPRTTEGVGQRIGIRHSESP